MSSASTSSFRYLPFFWISASRFSRAAISFSVAGIVPYPISLHRVGALAQPRQLLLDPRAALLGSLVLLLGERLQLDLELHDLPLDLVDLLRQRIDRDAQPRRSFVHEIDRLVGQEPVRDVPMRQRRRGDERIIGDAHTVVHLVLFLQAAQNRDRVFDRRLTHKDGLEAPLQRGVLLDILAVFVQRRGADDVQLAARQCGLQHVGGVHRPLRAPGTDERVQLIDETDEPPFRLRDLLEHRLEPFLELAAVLGARDQRAEVVYLCAPCR